MKKTIYIHKKGILHYKPIWISLNNGKYKLYYSNAIKLSSEQRENTIKIREFFFIHSKKITANIDDLPISLNIQLASLRRWLDAGILVLPLLIILNLMLPWRIMPTEALLYILFGYIAMVPILTFLFIRKKYFEVSIRF
ncbi:MAG: hypothetical protein RBS19_07710 [Bacteroidales bacterium]|nr:hypothetical protein [Bacteroidales bacterium]MDY0216823.1 hypothetical protein [Bacteroidales bacterium]